MTALERAHEAEELLRRLVEWEERMGGWEAQGWLDARAYLEAVATSSD